MEDSFEDQPSSAIDYSDDDEAKSSSSSSQSESEKSTKADLNSADVKLQQMRRVARKKRGEGHKLKVLI